MRERNEARWDYMSPGITFCLRRGTITIFKTTLDAIGYPEFYRFLYNHEAGKLALEPCGMNDPGANALQNIRQEETYDVNSVDFVRMMYRENKWDADISYRIAGRAYPVNSAVEFNLSDALEIREGILKERTIR